MNDDTQSSALAQLADRLDRGGLGLRKHCSGRHCRCAENVKALAGYVLEISIAKDPLAHDLEMLARHCFASPALMELLRNYTFDRERFARAAQTSSELTTILACLIDVGRIRQKDNQPGQWMEDSP
jgi:hypothetical protein